MKKFLQKQPTTQTQAEESPAQPDAPNVLTEEEQEQVVDKSKDKAMSALKAAAEKLKKWKVKGSLSVEMTVLMLTLSYRLDVDFSEMEQQQTSRKLPAITSTPDEMRGTQGDETLYLKPDQIRDPVGSEPRGEKISSNYFVRKLNNSLENMREKLIANAKKMKDNGFSGTVGVAVTFGVPKILTFGEDVDMTIGIEVALTDMLAAQQSLLAEQAKRTCRLDVWMKKAGNLTPMNKDGTSDIYAVCQIEGTRLKDKRRTKSVPGTNNPEWKERLPPIPVAPLGEDEELVITLFHHNKFGADEFVDEIIIKLDALGLKAGKGQDVWAVLRKFDETTEQTPPFMFFNLKYTEVPVTDADLTPDLGAQAMAPVNLGPWGCTIKVLECEGLKAVDKSGTSDPYVKLKVDKHSFKTKVVPKTVNPHFNEEFVVPDLLHQSDLFIEVWDQNKFKDEFLGQYGLRMGTVRNTLENPINQGKPFEVSYTLLPRDGKNDAVSGKIKLLFTKA